MSDNKVVEAHMKGITVLLQKVTEYGFFIAEYAEQQKNFLINVSHYNEWAMFDLGRFLFSFLLLQHADLGTPPQQLWRANKSVAIVGAGSAGLAMLRALVDVQEELDSHLDIVLYEQRQDVGGVWLPDPQPVRPPVFPKTPLYPQLHINVPAPVMTFPGIPYPPGTPLYARHEYVEKYHQDIALRFNLWPYISLNHTVMSASWVGTSEEGRWDVVVDDQDGHKTSRSFDHLVVASGRYHYPHIPTFLGQDEWLRQRNSPSGRRREITHSIFYREPRQYADQTVVVVGSGPSGYDVTSQVALYARKVYFSVRNLPLPAPDSSEVKPEIAYFTPDAIVFSDGSRVYDVDSVVLGTGYDLRIPFLETTGELTVKPKANERGHVLTTNLRYLFPLHEHVFSLSSSYPTNALAFVGLPYNAYIIATDFAESIYAARAIVNCSCMGVREDLFKDLDAREDELRSEGYDPYYIGHRMPTYSAQFEYQEGLMDKLKRRGAIPEDGKVYVDAWRRESVSYVYLKRAWDRVEELGLQREWLKGVETEAEWADMMKRLNAWQEEWETRQGLVFVEEPTLY